jgi:S-DNA-T family DNA segregation ATPase FtsK/SpoIIIE
MSTPADHNPEPVNDREDTTVNTPESDPVNTTPTDTVNTDTTRADRRAVNGNVVEFKPGTARTPEEIPEPRTGAEVAASEVIDAEIVEDTPAADAVAVSVDPVAVTPSWWETVADATARPLVASWLLSAEEFTARAKFLVRYAGHATAFHALRVPVYVPVAVLKAPGALLRHGARLRNWVYDAESKPVRLAARDKADIDQYMKMREARNDAVRRRSAPVLFAVAVLAAIVYLAISYLTPFWNWVALVTALALIGWFGAPADNPVAGRAGPQAHLLNDRRRAVLARYRRAQQGVQQGQEGRFPQPDPT